MINAHIVDNIYHIEIPRQPNNRKLIKKTIYLLLRENFKMQCKFLPHRSVCPQMDKFILIISLFSQSSGGIVVKSILVATKRLNIIFFTYDMFGMIQLPCHKRMWFKQDKHKSLARCRAALISYVLYKHDTRHEMCQSLKIKLLRSIMQSQIGCREILSIAASNETSEGISDAAYV